ncbi:hypothetical protein PybrP1_002903 [[Pythium] brassicae (nom. inval.)]|nr:hypothetical protein PybrP1_002903 [[Pythium] brassicae (nom. inval.)]
MATLLLRMAAAAALVAGAAHAAAFGISLESSKIALSGDALRLGLVLSPAQAHVTELTIDTLVDTTGAAVFSNLKVAGDGSTFVAALDGANKLPAGMYKLKVTAAGAEGEGAVSEVLQLKVTVPVTVASAELNGLALAAGETIASQEFSSGSGDALRVDVRLQQTHDQAAVVAHQAFLRFSLAREKSADTYFVLVADAAKTHSAVLQFAALSKKFGYRSGLYTLQLILGDPTFAQAIVWDLGQVELQLASAPPPTPSPLYAKHLLHESDTTLTALPEIAHVMRAQDPRPPVAVSLAFTAAVLAPLVGFLGFVLSLGLNVRKLFRGSVLVFGAGFLASLAGILVLFGLYWLELTMFRTLGYLTVLGSVNLAFGHLTLKRLAAMDAAAAPKKPKHD